MRSWKKVFGSAIFRLIVIVMAVVIPLNLLTLILGNQTITEAERQISLETQNALNLYMKQVDDSLERMNTTMYLMAREDEDFVRLNVKEVTNDTEYYRQLQSVVRLGITMKEELEDNSMVDGIFAYFHEKGHYIVQGGTSYQINAVQKMVKGNLDALLEDGFRKWEFIEIEGAPYLLLTAVYRNACYGAWISLEELAIMLGFSDLGTQAFTDGTGRVYYSSKANLENLDMNAQYKWYKGIDHTVVKAKSEHTDLYFVQLLSKGEISESLPATIRVLQTLSVVAVAIIPIILIAMRYWIGRPVDKLMTAMERIEQGDVSYRIPETQGGTEFDRINRNFNHAMDEVAELKIHMYEQRLKAEKVRLGFLSQQIQPHFIINTLNILYSYEPKDYQLSQKMILCLSKYFRYVVNAHQDYVELGREMEHIRNYFEIQQARFLRSFHAAVTYDEEVKNCLIPPLIIQNFTENAVKHSFIPGQVTSIVTEARREGDKIHICVYDTGAGIPDEVLDRIEDFRKNREFRSDLGVGIQNSIDRLNILYGDEAELNIARIHPQGTRIDIMIPIKRREAGEDECDFG